MFRFIPFGEGHLAIFRSWLAQPHVRGFWEAPSDEASLRAKMLTSPEAGHVRRFVILGEGTPIGYAQYYDATQSDWPCWKSEPSGTFGLDLLVGNTASLG